jgi:hypothetical protein
MRNLIRFVVGAIFALGITTATAAVNVNPSHHASQVQTGAMVPPDFSSCDFSMPTTFTNTWYFDPVNGQTEAAYTTAGVSMDPTVTPHQGDAQHPWNSLQAVFQIGKSTTSGYSVSLWNLFSTPTNALSPIHDGDEVLLMSGDYGPLAMGFFNFQINASGPKLTIAQAPGQTAIVDKVGISNVSNIVFEGFTIQSLATATDTVPLIKMGDNFNNNLVLSHNVVFDHMTIQSAPYTTVASGWTQAQWTANARFGIWLGTNTCVSITNSKESVVNTGLAFEGVSKVQYASNDLSYFASDGIDFHDDDLLIAHNTIHDFINLGNGDHIDGMQGTIGVAAFPVSHRITIDSNYVVYQLDSTLPFVTGGTGFVPADLNGGIGMTNGIYENVYAYNNIVVWANISGISLNGCSYCGIENNTVLNSSVEVIGSDHVLVKNNLTGNLICTNVGPENHVAPNAAGTIQTLNNVLLKGGSGFLDFCVNGIQTHFSGGSIASGNYGGGNIIDVGGITSEIQQYDPATFTYNFHLLPTAPARGAGSSVDFSPAVDSNGVLLNNPPDVGAVAFP